MFSVGSSSCQTGAACPSARQTCFASPPPFRMSTTAPPPLHTHLLCQHTGSNYYVRILSTLNRELLKPSSSVALHRHSNALVDILPPEADSSISLLGDNEKPNVTYQVCCEDETVALCLLTQDWTGGCEESDVAYSEGLVDILPCKAASSCTFIERCLSLSHMLPPLPPPPYHVYVHLHCRTLEAMISRSRRSVRLWSCHSHRETCTGSWALTRPAVCCCMDLQAQVRVCVCGGVSCSDGAGWASECLFKPTGTVGVLPVAAPMSL